MKISLKRRGWHKDSAWVWMFLTSAAVVFFLAFFFYRSLWATLPLCWIGIACFHNLRKREQRIRKQQLSTQFRECILAVATLLQAGYSAENAFLECKRDMVLLFGERAAICKELRKIQRGLHINISLEELLVDMAERTECNDIVQFSRVFGLAKRNGGNMSEIIRGSAELIGKRIELGQEIQTSLSGKKMEITIMRMMPFGIVLYVELGNPGYFQMLYHNLTGVLVMTGCLFLYLAAYVLGERVMNSLWEETIGK